MNNTSQSHLFQYADNLTWTKGTHTTKYGFDIRTMQSITTLGIMGSIMSLCLLLPANYRCVLPDSAAAQYADFLAGTP